MIVEISYFRNEWYYPTEEPLGSLYFGVNSFFELFKLSENLYLIHLVESWGTRSYEYATTFYIIDNEREFLEKFLIEVKQLTQDRDIELETCEVTEKLKDTLLKYKGLSGISMHLKKFAEEIISKCEQ